jgi:DNA-binding response OmpR family regulator
MIRVLVIEDDHSVGAAIQLMLVCKGCETVLAPDANAGVQAFETSKFDVVMVDIFMPGIDGLKTLKGIRERAPTIPIVAVSGLDFAIPWVPGSTFSAWQLNSARYPVCASHLRPSS